MAARDRMDPKAKGREEKAKRKDLKARTKAAQK
jgi:hypothetical protein